MDEHALDISCLTVISSARARNVLRYFLHEQNVAMPPGTRLDEMLRQLLEAREDAAVCVDFGDWQVRRYQGRAYVLAAREKFDRALELRWQGEMEIHWPALNRVINFHRGYGQGVSLEKLQRAPVTLRLRNGGESMRLHSESATRSLKNLFQEHHVPPWQRERVPLLYSGNELVNVVGMAIAADYQARHGEESVLVSLEKLDYDSSNKKS
jgi:tRNA(Ile)-lysidine synthase